MIAFVASATITTGTSSGSTTAAANTTGANLIVLAVQYQMGATITVSDSAGNTWTALSAYGHSASSASQMYYCLNPVTSAAHTFTVSGSGSYAQISALAFSGAGAIDQQAGYCTTTIGNTSVQPGSITPSYANELIVSSVNNNALYSISINDSFTAYTYNQVNNVTFGGGIAYLIQTSAAAIDPTWSFAASSGNSVAAIASFRLGGGTAWTASLGENMGLTDAAAHTASFVRTIADNLGTTDVAAGATGYVRAVASPLGVTDVLARGYGKSVNDPLGVTDGTARAVGKSVNDPLGLTDSTSRAAGYSRSLNSPLGITDATARAAQFARTLFDGEGLTDLESSNVLHLIQVAIADTMGIADARARAAAFARAISDSEGLADSAAHAATYVRGLAAGMGLVDHATGDLTPAGGSAVLAYYNQLLAQE